MIGIMSDTLNGEELAAALKRCPEWDISEDEKVLTRTFEFEEFMEGIDFVNSIAEVADEAFHHPDIDIRYTKIVVGLTTHEVGGLTESDLELAIKIDRLL